MKTKCIASKNARKFEASYRFMIKWSSITLINVLLLISCTKNNDLETVNNELSTDNNTSTSDNSSPTDNESMIVYTDIQPDFESLNENDFYNLDLNNDGIVDFYLKSMGESWAFWIEPSSTEHKINALAAVSGPFESYIVPLNSDSLIYSNFENPLFYDSYGGYIVMDFCESFPTYCSYSWAYNYDKYLGLRFVINGLAHYGWARLDVTNNIQWKLKDYAYNATPNKPIIAGQKE